MDGNIHRRDVKIDYALNFALRKVGEGYIAAHQKAEAGIIVLEVNTLSHAGRVLVYEAENALICAASGPVHQIGFKLKAKIAALSLAKANGLALPLFRDKLQLQLSVIILNHP